MVVGEKVRIRLHKQRTYTSAALLNAGRGLSADSCVCLALPSQGVSNPCLRRGRAGLPSISPLSLYIVRIAIRTTIGYH